jgi:hypothetical protein
VLKKLLIILFVFLLALSPLCASELQQQDFDGFFKMDAPINDSFMQDPILIDPDIYGTLIFHDSNNEIDITHFYHCDNRTYVNDTVERLRANPDVEVYNESDLNFIQCNGSRAVLLQEDNKVIMISSSKLDFNTLKAMALSAEFKK